MSEPTILQIRTADEALENALQETNSPETAKLIKMIQNLKSGKARYAAVEIIKLLFSHD